MEQFTKFLGIDISKDVFDVCSADGKHHQFLNSTEGYLEFSRLLSQGSQCVMEATGSYHQKLATWLCSHGYAVSVVNPLVIKRFAQMRLRIAKTDKADAKIIRAYAQVERPVCWNPPPEYISQAFEINSLLDLLIRQRTALKNKQQSVSSKSDQFSKIIRSIERMVQCINAQIVAQEAVIEKLIKENQGEMFENLCSIPGIGKKTAMFLIVVTHGFEGFESSKQLSAYLGLAPTLRISGKTTRGQSRISKTGNTTIRNLLFMCSFTACERNKACRELFNRIVAKGKSKKLALIAVANKLLKQAFAIAKSEMKYEENHMSVSPQ
jgi:transposase